MIKTREKFLKPSQTGRYSSFFNTNFYWIKHNQKKEWTNPSRFFETSKDDQLKLPIRN